MRNFDELLHVELVATRRLAFAGVVAATLLMLPALAAATAQRAKPVRAADPAASAVVTAPGTSAQPRVSPYVIANRQHAEAAAAANPASAPLAVRRSKKAFGQQR
jgi:hypothetical protein